MPVCANSDSCNVNLRLHKNVSLASKLTLPLSLISSDILNEIPNNTQLKTMKKIATAPTIRAIRLRLSSDASTRLEEEEFRVDGVSSNRNSDISTCSDDKTTISS